MEPNNILSQDVHQIAPDGSAGNGLWIFALIIMIGAAGTLGYLNRKHSDVQTTSVPILEEKISDWQTYRHPAGFELQFPKTWTTSVPGKDDVQILFRSPEQNNEYDPFTNEYHPFAIIISIKQAAASDPRGEFGNAYPELDQWDDTRPSNPVFGKFNGYDAITYDTIGFGPMKVHLVVQYPKSFWISYATDQRNMEELNKVLSTFRLTQ